MRMWSLQRRLFILCIAVSCVTSAAGLIHVSGYEGSEVNVSCPYDAVYESNEKYLCNKYCGYDDVLLTTTESKKSKYSLHDDKKGRVFTATISDLSLTDVGTYWCGVNRVGLDKFTEVKLQVGRLTSTKFQSYEEGSVSFSCPYDSEHQNSLKYICRGNRTSTCLQRALVTSDSQKKGQFRLKDDKGSRKVTVTITNLTQEDAGWYLCGVQHTGLDVFSAVELVVKEWCCVKSNKLSGIVGRPVTMQCPYPPQHRDNRKFLCKGDHRTNCTDIMTSQSRLTLQDEAAFGSFLVTIRELEAGDAGTYWCGSDSQWSVGNYTRIQLSVVAAPFHSTLFTVVFIVAAVLLILTFALVIVYKYKCHKGQGAGVDTNRHKTKAAEAVSEAEIYENHDVVAHSKQGTSNPQTTYYHYDNDEGKDQEDPDYQNVSTTEDIYCNQSYIKAKR